MAMESAILFMLIIFSLCTLLCAVTLTGHYQTKLDKTLTENKVKLDQIGENFLAGKTVSSTGKYTVTTGSDNTLTVKQGDTVVLYIKKGSDGKPVCWRYSAPNGASSE